MTSVGYYSNLRIEFHDGFTDDLGPWRRVGEKAFAAGPQLRVPARALTVPRLWLGKPPGGFLL